MKSIRKTILLVEDEGLIALDESERLKRAGYSVIHAFSGEEAVRTVDENPEVADLILMDVDLDGGMSGTETARTILGHIRIPVLFLSSHAEPEIVSKTELISNYGYVSKSSDFSVLDASIKAAFRLFDAQEGIRAKNIEIESANERLRIALDKLEETNRELILAEDKFSKAFHVNPETMNINRMSDGVYLDVNEGYSRFMGYSREEVIGKTSLGNGLSVWVRDEDRTRLVNLVRECGAADEFETELRQKNDRIVTVLIFARAIEIGDEMCILSVTRDITEQRRSQETTSIRLAEKELLLREVHHRIRNNMTTMGSLLMLQAGTLKEPGAVAALEDARMRLRSMVVLYDKLFLTENLAEMSIREYLPALADEIVKVLSVAPIVRIETHVDEFTLPVKDLTNIGIIVNELLTNTMKHAFVGRSDGEITVAASKTDNRVMVIVADNGVGLPPSVALEGVAGFGFTIVETLTKQLGGVLRVERSNGTRVIVEFPV
ncbi:MAG TPA: histidine kinase dimerization/phosphoacceptor domain -containing protein [Spirochaetia bacterium]|nr:histidine kinase dimerization/phosphoacceptor domain -containing protein [Spirochaetia bacterium]